MKCLVIYILFITTIQLSHQSNFTIQIKDYFKRHHELQQKCMAEIHVDKNVEYNYETHGDIVNDENLACFVKCIVFHENVINEAGEISIEHIKENMHLPENDNLDGLIEKCSGFDTNDLCKGALQFVSCYSDYSETHVAPQ